MTPSDKPRFAMLINAMAAQFQRPASEAALQGYWMALGDLTLANLEVAVYRAMRERRYMPVASELRELAGSGEISLEDRAVVCWVRFLDALRRHGSYKTVDFDDAAVNHAVRSIRGWDEDFEPTSYEERRFRDAYCAYYRTGAGEGSPLIGAHDRHNGANGLGVKKPLVIECRLPPVPMLQAPYRRADALAADRKALVHEIGRLPE